MLPVLRRSTPTTWEDRWDWPPREMIRWLNELVEPGTSQSTLTGAYPVDMREDDKNVYVDAELPGFDKQEINVTLEDGALNISAERKAEEETGTSHLKERRYTRVQRRFSLPASVDESKVDAKYENGVLHLKMPKTPEEKPRRIKVA